MNIVRSAGTPRPVTYIVADGFVHSSVFSSQVLEPLRMLASSGIPVTLVIFEQFGLFFRSRQRIRDLQSAERSLNVLVVPRIPSLPLLWMNWLVLETAMLITRRRTSLYHCRGVRATVLALLSRFFRPDVHVLFDIRGDEMAETAMYTRGSLFGTWSVRLMDHLSAAAFRHATSVSAVSGTLSEMFSNRYGKREGVSVVPCAVQGSLFTVNDIDRREVRRELGLDGQTVFVYSGSITPYQMFDETCRVFAEIHRENPQSHFLVLTAETARAERTITEFGIPEKSRTVRTVPFRSVPRYLNAGDAAFLLRADDPVNWGASPVKFGEYLSCGLFVIATPFVGLVNETISRYHCGTLLDYPDGISRFKVQIRELMSQTDRTRIGEVGKKEFSWDSLIKRYHDLYMR